MNDEREEKSGLKVNDRRRFDASGNAREDDQPTVVVPPAATERAPEGAAGIAKSESKLAKPELQGGGGELNFSSFVISLATQALMQLGEMPPPDGMAIEPDMEAARQTIAILGLIEEKTKGNLIPEEAELLKEVLHSVRICYVRRSKEA